VNIVLGLAAYSLLLILHLGLEVREHRLRVCKQKQKHYGLRLTHEWEVNSILKET